MTDYHDYMNTHKTYPDDISRRIDIAPGFDSVRPPVKESLTTAEPCAWCNPEHHLLRFNVSWWVRASTGKRKWMSVTQQNKANYCPMCGRKLEERQ